MHTKWFTRATLISWMHCRSDTQHQDNIALRISEHLAAIKSQRNLNVGSLLLSSQRWLLQESIQCGLLLQLSLECLSRTYSAVHLMPPQLLVL